MVYINIIFICLFLNIYVRSPFFNITKIPLSRVFTLNTFILLRVFKSVDRAEKWSALFV